MVRRRDSRRSLGHELADDLRTRILSGEFAPHDKLPSEAELGAEYGVSRVTVRTALQLMESRGLIDKRHGSGSFVAGLHGGIRAGLQELRSISDTIRELGHEPTAQRLSIEIGPATDREAERLSVGRGESVWHLQRAISADGELVAYSHDAIPTSVIPAPRDGRIDVDRERLGIGSVFAHLESIGHAPARAVAEIHAVDGADEPLLQRGAGRGLYLLLDQLHESWRGRPVLYSRTYFVEGGFQFVILRTR